MKWDAIRFDWNHARAFLATARLGSFSAAARALHLTQPTLGRQVAALEEELGVTLFERVGRQLELTDAGHLLLARVGDMGEAALAVSLSASGSVQDISGRVTISVSDMFAAHFLPKVLDVLQVKAPQIEIEIHASNKIADLQRREADIAIRHVRPEQNELIARKIHETPAKLFAATRYLERKGRPLVVSDLSHHEFIAMGQPEQMLAELHELGIPVQRENIRVITESSFVVWEFVKNGLGITAMIPEVARATPGVEMVLPNFTAMQVPFWLAVHRELHTSRRIRLVYDVLAAMLPRVAASGVTPEA
jgi:DNA-binding transcriptional LysR family regulator